MLPVGKGSGKQLAATTMAFVRLLRDLMRDKGIGDRIVPIIPDEAPDLWHGGVSANVWSVTSWTELRRHGLRALKHNFLFPEEEVRCPM
jgi:pyruvate dehydrogenase complex dehydrogenase (E1) component